MPNNPNYQNSSANDFPDLVEQNLIAPLESEMRYQTLLDNASIIFFVVNSNGVVTLAEGAGLKSLHLTPAQVVGKTIEHLYRDHSKVLDYTRRALKGESFTAIDELAGMTFEVRYNPLYGADGAVCGTVGVATDVTERKIAETKSAELIVKLNSAADREALLNRLGTSIRNSLQLPKVLHAATFELGSALGVSRVYLRVFESLPRNVPAQYIYTAPNILDPPPTIVRYNQPIGKFILENRISVIFDDLQNPPDQYRAMHEYVRNNLVVRGVRSAVYCPILVNDYFHATLCIEQNDCLRQWTEDDLWLIHSVGGQLSLAIAHAQSFELTRRAKREWEITFDAMSDGIFIFNREGVLQRVNVAGAAMEQNTPLNLVGVHCCQMLLSDSDQENANHCLVQHVIETGASITVERRSKLLQKPLLMVCEPIYNENNRLTGAVLTARDLYELRAAEAVAREHQLLLTHVLEGMLEPVFAVDERGKILWCNNATKEFYSSGTTEIFERDFLEMVHPADQAMAQAALAASLTKVPQNYESRYLNKRGETRHAVFNSVPLAQDKGINSVLWFVRDITEQKMALQQALQADKLRALGQLASGVAHDFNNVLAAILGRVSLLQRRVTDENISHNLQIIQTAAEDAAATVRRIQTFARQSAKPDYSAVELNSLLRDSIELTRTRWEDEARQRNVTYTVELAQTNVFFTFGNASELREVFVNLIVNALDAMPRGGKLSIRPGLVDKFVILKFMDGGEGVAEEMRERIFEPFFSTKGVDGMGLGLSISYSIIKQHGGSITVESGDGGGGAAFIVTLPVCDSHQTHDTALKSLESKQKLTVLVVDDEDYVREALSEMVSELVSDVVTAKNAQEALIKLETKRVDVIFTDLSMPEMDGWEFSKNVRRKWSETKIVLVTGYGKGLPLEPENANLVDAIIGKPFDFPHLSQTLEKVTARNDDSK